MEEVSLTLTLTNDASVKILGDVDGLTKTH